MKEIPEDIKGRAKLLIEIAEKLERDGIGADNPAEKEHIDTVRDTAEWILNPKLVDHPFPDDLYEY